MNFKYQTVRELAVKNPGRDEPRMMGEQASRYPECARLYRQGAAGFPDTTGIAFLGRLLNGGEGLSLMAFNLPSPGDLGRYDSYQGVVETRGVRYGFTISKPDGQDYIWDGFIIFDESMVSSGSPVTVLPVNSETGRSGEPVLAGVLRSC